jgi:hypothetical protein
MITFDFLCSAGHRFEGWFASSHEYTKQADSGLLLCPNCGDIQISKAVSAPFVGRKGNQAVSPSMANEASQCAPTAMINVPEMPAELAKKLAEFQSELLSNSEYVGSKFVDEARSIHYGEVESRFIHGEATAEQACELVDEGIGIMPLPFTVLAPNERN